MTTLRTAALAALLLAAAAARAEPAWISDRLQAGLHEQPDPASTVLTLLSSGTPVEVLERDDGLARVRTQNGTEGWVDAMYLSEERPAALVLADVEAARADTAAELEAARERIAELEAEAAADAPAGGGNGVQAASFEAPVNSETLRELQRLAEENQRIRQQLAEAEAAAAMAMERVEDAGEDPQPAAAPSRPPAASAYLHYLLALRDWSPWYWLALASTLLLAFGLGLWVADLGVKRRHGGFRVRV